MDAPSPRAGQVDVVVVTYNSEDDAQGCLDALLASDAVHRVLVVDNKSTDGTVDVLRGYGDRIELFALDVNTGFAEGVNTGVRAADCGLVALVNPDAHVEPDCLGLLAEHLRRRHDVAVAAAMLRYPDGRPQMFARREPTLRTTLWNLTLLGERMDRRWRGRASAAHRSYEREFAAVGDEPLVVDSPAAACVVLRRDDLPDPPMDPTFPLFFNDTDLYRRLRDAGGRIEVVPQARATHGYGSSHRRVDQGRKRAEYVVSMRRYAQRHWSPVRRAVLWWLLLLDTASSAIVGVVRRSDARARRHARGTAGGLGLPGGSTPWLSDARGRIPERS